MCKKLWIMALVVLAGLFVVRKTEFGARMAERAHKWWAANVEKKDTPEKRLAQAKVEIAKIDDDIRDRANEEVRVEMELRRTQKALNDQAKEQAGREERLRSMTTALKSQNVLVTFDGLDYKRQELAKRLFDLTTVFNQQKEAIAATETSIKTLQETLNDIGKDVMALKDKKTQLTAKVVEAERSLGQLRREQSANRCCDGQPSTHADRAEKLLEQVDDGIAEAKLRQQKYQKYGLVKEPVRLDPVAEGVNEEAAIKAAEKALAK